MSVLAQSKFQPNSGKKILVVGQDLGSIGGFVSPHNTGYCDYFERIPAGFTSYTSINRLEGLTELTNYGSGDIYAKQIVDNPKFKNTVLCLGLYMVGIESEIAAGDYDANIASLATWIKNTNKPVFLRIGYEFNSEWANYNPANYIKSFKRIVDQFELNQVNNVAFVWQSDGLGSGSDLLKWYPGNDYVDWFAYSHFHNKGEGMLQLARENSKPVMIAEATPQGYNLAETEAEQAWADWFLPLFDHINTNNDVIQALCYINCNWDEQPMWLNQNWGDTRIENNPSLMALWNTELERSEWLLQSDTLYAAINYTPNTSSLDRYNKKAEISIINGQCSVLLENRFLGQVDIFVTDLMGRCLFEKKYHKIP